MNCTFFTFELIIKSEWETEKYDRVRNIPGWYFISLLLTGLNGTFILCSNLSVIYGFHYMKKFVTLVFLGHGAWKVYFLIFLCSLFLVPLQQEMKRIEFCPVTKANKPSSKME